MAVSLDIARDISGKVGAERCEEQQGEVQHLVVELDELLGGQGGRGGEEGALILIREKNGVWGTGA